MIAPAYTITCMAAIKRAPRVANNPAIQHITRIRYMADVNGFVRVTTITAAKTEIIARIENISINPLG
jgi:hypothetical protein